MHMDKKIQLGLRSGQFVCSIIILSLCSYIDKWSVANTSNSRHAASPIGFLIFTPVFSIFSGAFLQFAPCFISRPLNRFIPLLLISLNALFYICGFIALVVYISTLNYCRGPVCDTAKAASFFTAISYLVWLAEAVLMGLAILRNQRGILLSLKDDYEDDMENEEQEDLEADDHSDGFQRKHNSGGEKLSDVKL